MGVRTALDLSGVNIYDDVLRNVLFLVTLTVSATYLLSGFPFAPLFEEASRLRGLFRISFATFYLLVLWRTKDALPLLYGYKTVRENSKPWTVRAYYFQVVCCVFLLVGLLTDIAAVTLFLSRLVEIERSKKFGLENTIYQLVIVHLPFLGLGEALAVDQIIGFPSILASAVMFNSLFVSVGIMFLSGGFHKMGSDLWQTGEAVGEFLKLPYIRAEPLSGITVSVPDGVSKVFSYGMIVAQLSLLFSVVNKYAFLLLCIVFIGFAMSAFLFVDLSFIGQVLLAVFGLLGGSVALHITSYPALSLLSSVNATPFTLIALFINTIGLVTIFRPDLVVGTPIRTLSRLFSGHNAPVMPFNEHHYFGVHTFRLLYETEDGTKTPVLEVFDEDGWQKQFFFPRCYETCVWSVTDFCLDQYDGASGGGDNIPEIKDLCYTGLLTTGNQTGTVYLQIKIYNRDVEEYINSDWHTLGRCEFNSENANWELLNQPPRIENHPRLSFASEFKNA